MKKVKVLALVTAVIAAVLLYSYLNSLSKTASLEVKKTGVVTASVNIPPNTPIVKEMLTVTQLPVEAIHEQSLKKTDDIIGKVSESEIIAGEQILSSKLIATGQGQKPGTLAYSVQPGMRAITIAVSNTTGLSNMIIPDDRVDIIGQYEVEAQQSNGESKNIDYTTMLAENVKVLAVDNSMTDKDKDSKENPYVTLTLEVTPSQAMEISMTESKGQLRAIMRSPLDDKKTALPPLTVDKVIFKTN